MRHAAFFLHPAAAGDHGGGQHQAALAFEQAGPQDQVGDAGLVLCCDEHDALGRAWLLPHQHQPGHHHAPPVAHAVQPGASDHAALGQLRAQERDRVLAQREADGAVILHHLPPRQHRVQHHGRLDDLRLRRPAFGGHEQRQRAVGQGPDRPQRRPAVLVERTVRIGLRQPLERRHRHAGPPPELVHGGVGVLTPPGDDGDAVLLRQAFGHA